MTLCCMAARQERDAQGIGQTGLEMPVASVLLTFAVAKETAAGAASRFTSCKA